MRRVLRRRLSHRCVHPRSVLMSADGDPGKEPHRGWAKVHVPRPLSQRVLAGSAGAAPQRGSDNLGVGEPRGGGGGRRNCLTTRKVTVK